MAAIAFRQCKGKNMEVDQNSVENEVVTQDPQPEVVENNEPSTEQEQAQGSHDPSEEQERNWRELRRKHRETVAREKAKDELIEKLLNAQKAEEQQKVVEPDEFANVSADDYLTFDQTDKRIEKRAEAIAERKYRELKEQEEKNRFLERLQSKYTDFQDVVNPDSIALFEEKEPELAETIAALKDPYKMGLQTYHFLKKSGLVGEVDEKRHAKEVEKKIEQNKKTVESPQTFSKRPMAQAFRLTSADKTKLYEEMMSAARGVSNGY